MALNAKITGHNKSLINYFCCLVEGDQVLEWNHVSMVDVSFEQVKNIVANSPDDVTLVVCHNTSR